MIFENLPYTNFHDLNLDWIIKFIMEAKDKWPEMYNELMKLKVNKPQELPDGELGDYLVSLGDGRTEWRPLDAEISTQIVETVNQWLDDHPEATTTVQDGAISYPKLDDVLKGVVYNPDVETGNDYQKLQAVINKAIENECATIILPRMYDITGYSLLINKGLYDSTTHVRKKLTFLGINKGGIQKQDGGFVFTGSEPVDFFSAGDVQFINVFFKGPNTLVDIVKDAYCSIFDCHKIIRITTFGCSYWNVGTVFDGSLSVNSSTNMQQVVNFGDVCSYSHAYFKLGSTWVVESNGCTIEECDYGYKAVGSPITSLHIHGCTIEGCRYEAVDLDQGGLQWSGTDIIIENCYFEANSSGRELKRDIYINFRFMYSVSITNNHFATTGDEYHCIDILARNTLYNIDGNNVAAANTNTTLIYWDFSQYPANVPYVIYHKYNYAGDGLVTNRADIFKEFRGAIPFSAVGLSDNNIPTDINTLATGDYPMSAIAQVLPADSIQNGPPGVTQGTLLNFKPNAGNGMQMMGDPSGPAWYRTRRSGYGFSGWKPLNGSYVFRRSNLKHGDVVSLPVTGFDMVITCFPEYTSAAHVCLTFPCTVVNASATEFTFKAFDPTTKSPSAETGLSMIFLLTPMA